MNNDLYISGRFQFNSKPLENGPEWGMSLLKAGSMRFRWNENNQNRIDFLNELRGKDQVVVAPELIHSKIVYCPEKASDLDGKTGDGVVTDNRSFIPAVTVADCMPIFLYDRKTGAFGTLHSGWKGTGIVEVAVDKMREKYGSRVEDICVVLGPHIHSCCYKVDAERASYFTSNFGEKCVVPLEWENGVLNVADGNGNVLPSQYKYSLSLAEANLFVLRNLGIPEGNVIVSNDCTCCEEKYGSFRRENSAKGTFTVQVAWVKW